MWLCCPRYLFLVVVQRILQQQESKKAMLREMCATNEGYSEGKDNWKNLPVNELDFLIVDDNHGIIYCFVPKARPEMFWHTIACVCETLHLVLCSRSPVPTGRGSCLSCATTIPGLMRIRCPYRPIGSMITRTWLSSATSQNQRGLSAHLFKSGIIPLI